MQSCRAATNFPAKSHCLDVFICLENSIAWSHFQNKWNHKWIMIAFSFKQLNNTYQSLMHGSLLFSIVSRILFFEGRSRLIVYLEFEKIRAEKKSVIWVNNSHTGHAYKGLRKHRLWSYNDDFHHKCTRKFQCTGQLEISQKIFSIILTMQENS